MVLWTGVQSSSAPPSSTFYPCKPRVGRAFSLLKTVYKNARLTASVSRAFSSFTGESGDTEFAIAICTYRGSGKSGKSGHTAIPTLQKISRCSETCSATAENTNTQRLARSSSGIHQAKCSKAGSRSSRGSTKTRNSHSN